MFESLPPTLKTLVVCDSESRPFRFWGRRATRTNPPAQPHTGVIRRLSFRLEKFQPETILDARDFLLPFLPPHLQPDATVEAGKEDCHWPELRTILLASAFPTSPTGMKTDDLLLALASAVKRMPRLESAELRWINGEFRGQFEYYREETGSQVTWKYLQFGEAVLHAWEDVALTHSEGRCGLTKAKDVSRKP